MAEKSIVFLPNNLRYKLSELLAEKRPDIEQESITRMNILPDSEMYKQREKFFKEHQNIFSDSLYEKDYPIERYEAFISNIAPEQVLEKAKYFYLGKEDEEFIAHETANMIRCLVKITENQDDAVVLPLDCRKFDIIGGDDELERLNCLISEKNLSEEDILLIFSAIRKKVLIVYRHPFRFFTHFCSILLLRAFRAGTEPERQRAINAERRIPDRQCRPWAKCFVLNFAAGPKSSLKSGNESSFAGELSIAASRVPH